MKTPNTKNAAIVVAGGQGLRARSATSDLPKQYQPLAGKAVMAWSLNAFLEHPEIDIVLPVISADAEDMFKAFVEPALSGDCITPVFGGDTRQHSVRNGLSALENLGVGKVLIHDAARPLVSAEVISAVIADLAENPGAIAASPVADTLKRQDGKDTVISTTESREGMWAAQTPQGFDYDLIFKLHKEYQNENLTDDAALLELAGHPVVLTQSTARNFKITRSEDFKLAEMYLGSDPRETRTGQGFDVHAFEAGDAVVLCGVSIPHTRKLKGHSDADVAMHALTDALYGAISEGDIGTHFPPSDEKWRGAASNVFWSMHVI